MVLMHAPHLITILQVAQKRQILPEAISILAVAAATTRICICDDVERPALSRMSAATLPLLSRTRPP